MGKRRKARELALQLLYQLDVQGESNPEPHLAEFWTRHPVDREVREFAEILIRGAKLHEPKIDEIISQSAQNWELDRMAVVDRNILRQGIFELLADAAGDHLAHLKEFMCRWGVGRRESAVLASKCRHGCR